VTTTVNRRTTASSGGTVITNNGTGTSGVADMSGAAVAYGGVARLTGTLGTVGATLDGWAFRQSVLGATTGIEGAQTMQCREYGSAASAGQAITVPAGTSNGVSVLVSAGGAGSVAVGSILITIIAE